MLARTASPFRPKLAGLWLPGLLVLAVAAQRPGEGRAELTTAGLAELVKPTIPLKSTWTDPQGKVVERDMKILSEGPVSILAVPSSIVIGKETRPFDVPWETQRFLEAFKIYHPKVAEEDVWKKFFADADAIVTREIALISEHQGDDSDLLSKLAGPNREFNKLFLATLKEYAQAKGKKGGPGYGGAAEYVIDFHLTPDAPGANVSVVGVAYLRAATMAGVDRRPDIWRDVTRGKSMRLKYGDYFIKARWPDGGATDKKVLIDKNERIELEPDKKDQ